MVRVGLKAMRYLILLSLSFCFGRWISEGEPPNSPAILHQQRFPACATTWVLTDLDGDHRPELATGAPDGHAYNIEIQYSARKDRVSIALANAEFGVGLFAYDVDRDDDEDLVASNPFSPEPFVVWLNDGHGLFHEADHWSCSYLLSGDMSSAVSNSVNDKDPKSASETGRSLYGRLVLASASIDFNLEGSVSPRSQAPYSESLSFGLSARSPPFAPAS